MATITGNHSYDKGRGDVRLLVACALVLEAAFALPHLAATDAQRAGLLLLSYVIGGAAFACVLWTLRHKEHHSNRRTTVIVIIVAAAAFRATLLPLSPATSPDVYRYLWEGLVQARGLNPFTLAPNAEELLPLSQSFPALAEAVTYPHIATIYPPTAQFLFLVNAVTFPGNLLGWKLILVLFDALLAIGTWMLLRARSLSPRYLAAVLWCPLLILESYEAGHLDLIGASLLVTAFVAMERKRPALSGVALGLCINVKYLWPLLLLMFLLCRRGPKRHAIVLAVTTVAVAGAVWIPFRSGLTSAFATAKMFSETWAFNDLAFELLRLIPGPRWLPMLLASGVLFTLASVLAFRRSKDAWRDLWLLTGAALLLSPVAYPWYFVWLVPGLAIRPPAWLVAWILVVPVLHLVDWRFAVTKEWNSMVWLWATVSIVPTVLLIRALWQRLIRPDDDPATATPPTTTDDGHDTSRVSELAHER